MKRILLAVIAVLGLCGEAMATENAWGETLFNSNRKFWFELYRPKVNYPYTTCPGSTDINQLGATIYGIDIYFGHSTDSGVSFTAGGGWVLDYISYSPDVNDFCASSAYVVQVGLHTTSAATAAINDWLAGSEEEYVSYIGQASTGIAETTTCDAFNQHYCAIGWVTGVGFTTGEYTTVWWGASESLGSGSPPGCHPECELVDPKTTGAVDRPWGAIKRLYR